MTMGMGMDMSFEQEMSQDPVADAIMMDPDDPERLPAIIEANQQQQGLMREFIREQFTEHDGHIAGYLNRFTQDVNQVLEAHFNVLHNEHKMLTGDMAEIKKAVNNSLQSFIMEFKAEIGEFRQESEARYMELQDQITANTDDIQRIKAHLGLT